MLEIKETSHTTSRSIGLVFFMRVFGGVLNVVILDLRINHWNRVCTILISTATIGRGAVHTVWRQAARQSGLHLGADQGE